MSRIRWVGLLSSLLIVGVLGGLMTPPPANAGTPALVIDGISIALVQGGTNCPTGSDKTTWLAFNGTTDGQPLAANKSNGVQGCYSIVNLQSASTFVPTGSSWTLGNFSGTNKGRVLVNDTMGSDWMKASGMTIFPHLNTAGSATASQITSSTLSNPPPSNPRFDDGTPCTGPTPPGACRVGLLTLSNNFNASGGQNNIGVFSWGLSVDGSIDLNGTENAANDRFRIIGTGCETANCTPPVRTGGAGVSGRQVGNGTFVRRQGGTIDVPFVEKSQGVRLGVITSTSVTTDPVITANNALPEMDDPCDSGNGKCTPVLRMDYIFWVQGRDTIKMGDSMNSCSGSCNRLEAVTTPAKKFIQKCGAPDEEGTFVNECTEHIKSAAQTEIGLCPGCEPPEMCDGTCIIITMTGTPAGQSTGKEFNFDSVSGQGVGDFQLKLDSNGYAEHTFSNLDADTVVTPNPLIDRFFQIDTYPLNKKGVPYQTDQILCTSQLNLRLGQQITRWEVGFDGSNSSNKLNLTVFTLGEGDILSCNWHTH